VRVTVLKKILEDPGLSEAWNTLVLAMHNRFGFRMRRVLGDDCPRASRLLMSRIGNAMSFPGCKPRGGSKFANRSTQENSGRFFAAAALE
jgi:hypothetical protein